MVNGLPQIVQISNFHSNNFERDFLRTLLFLCNFFFVLTTSPLLYNFGNEFANSTLRNANNNYNLQAPISILFQPQRETTKICWWTIICDVQEVPIIVVIFFILLLWSSHCTEKIIDCGIRWSQEKTCGQYVHKVRPIDYCLLRGGPQQHLSKIDQSFCSSIGRTAAVRRSTPVCLALVDTWSAETSFPSSINQNSQTYFHCEFCG